MNMEWMRTSRRLLGLIFTPALLALLSGCYGWSASERPLTSQLRSRDAPQILRIQRADGRTITMYAPRVESEHVVGFETDPDEIGPSLPDEIAVPLSEIRRYELRRLSKGTTALVAAGSVLGASGVLAALACIGGCY